MNVLVIAPHADDEIIGVGGTIAKRVREGHNVHVLVVTSPTTPDYDSELCWLIRTESKASHKVLGVCNTEYRDLPTLHTFSDRQKEISEAVFRAFEKLKPEEVYIPHIGDMHYEHKMIAQAAMVALRPNRIIKTKILAYEVPSETGWDVPNQQNAFIPNVYESLQMCDMRTKVNALTCFGSQMNAYPHERSIKSIINLSERRGSESYNDNAEAFMLIREIR